MVAKTHTFEMIEKSPKVQSEAEFYNSAMVQKEREFTPKNECESLCSIDDLFDTPCKSERRT